MFSGSGTAILAYFPVLSYCSTISLFSNLSDILSLISWIVGVALKKSPRSRKFVWKHFVCSLFNLLLHLWGLGCVKVGFLSRSMASLRLPCCTTLCVAVTMLVFWHNGSKDRQENWLYHTSSRRVWIGQVTWLFALKFAASLWLLVARVLAVRQH